MITRNTEDFIEFIYTNKYYIYRKKDKQQYQTWYSGAIIDSIWNGLSDDRPIVAELKIHLKKLLRLEKMNRIINE